MTNGDAGAGETPGHPEIEEWIAELGAALHIDPARVDVEGLLRLAGRAAHTVVRPAAPVTTFVIGYFAGLSEASGRLDYATAHAEAVDTAEALLRRRGT